jgi:hypothetical protein
MPDHKTRETSEAAARDPTQRTSPKSAATTAQTLPGLQRSVKWGMAYNGVGDGWNRESANREGARLILERIDWNSAGVLLFNKRERVCFTIDRTLVDHALQLAPWADSARNNQLRDRDADWRSGERRMEPKR